MSIRSLDALFAPRSIAIIGASSDPGKSGARVQQALKSTRYEGQIYLVSPTQQKIGDLVCYPSVRDLPQPADLAAICVRAASVPAAIRECGQAGIRAAVVFADGFLNSALGSELSAALTEARAASGLRVLGPNTVGVRNSASWTYVTFSWRPKDRLPGGPVATITQSGGMGTVFGKAMLRRRGLGPRYAIDTGNEFDVDVAECVEYVATDPEVACISIIIEGFRDGRRLVEAVRNARAQGKPVVFLKSGRSQAAIAQVASHTGALAGSFEVFDSALRDAGACVVQDEGELTDAVMLHSFKCVPKGRRIGVITGSGGSAILAMDAAARYDMILPPPGNPMTNEEKAVFSGAHPANPFDMGGAQGGVVERWTTALKWMNSQPNIDAVIMWHANYLEVEDEQQRYFPILAEAAGNSDKPLFCCGLTTPAFEQRLRDIGILFFSEPTRLIKALGIVTPPPSRTAAPIVQPPPAPESRTILTGMAARTIAAQWGKVLPYVKTIVVDGIHALPDAVRAAGTDKVILKVESERIAHKTEFGLVSAPVTPAEAAQAYEKLDLARRACGDSAAPIVVQAFERGTEIALGGYLDPVFGPVIMVALGGIYLEIFRDTAFATAPVSREKAFEMLLSLKAADILRGARGRKPADLDATADAMVSFSRFFADNIDRYAEVDINPLMVRSVGEGVVAVDLLLVPRGS